MGVSSQIKDQQLEHAIAFGQMLRRWRFANGWTQYTAGDFAAMAEPPMDAPSHSGASEIENAKIAHPRDTYYLFLGELNRRVADQNWAGVTKRKLLNQLQGSKPITHDDGRLWSAQDFWCCHAGILAAPEWLSGETETMAPLMGEAQIKELGEVWKTLILEAGAAAELGPLRALGSFVNSIPSGHRDAVSDGLVNGFTTDSLSRLWDSMAGEWQMQAWISRWRDGLNVAPSGGGGADRHGELMGLSPGLAKS